MSAMSHVSTATLTEALAAYRQTREDAYLAADERLRAGDRAGWEAESRRAWSAAQVCETLAAELAGR